MKVKIVLLLGVCFQACFANDFKSFQVKFSKTYQDTEITLRKQIFNNNLAKIEEHNKRYQEGSETYQMGVNQFADMTEEEFTSKFNTWQLDDALLTNAKKLDTTTVNADNLPKDIDWRKKGIVTPVKNQGQCGGCWAFSATGTLEGQLALKYNNLTSLSEQQLLDCSTANKGCEGGVVQYAINYVVQNGITTEKEYPYRATEGTCSSSNKPVVAGAEGYVTIEAYNETDLKVAVASIGPISVAVNANPIQLYSSGIFNQTCSDDINHGVLVVGYGTVNSTGAQYWIIKNSWGSTWGESGYYRLAMGVGTGLCGIARQACYPIGVVDHVVPQNNTVGALWQNKFLYIFALLAVAVHNFL